jgi:hypothetical protein
LLVWSFIAGITAVAAPPDAGEPTPSIEWQDLVPAHWEPPLIEVAHDEVEQRGIDPASVVRDLDGRRVRLAGFMKPVEYQGRTVSAFLLVPFLPHHVKQHAHLDANQRVYVSLAEPLVVEQPFEPLWVMGLMQVATTFTEEGPAGYAISAARTALYSY